MATQPTAIITGAGRGIGRASAVQLSRDGYRLALTARSEHELHETARLCGDGAAVFAADVSDASAVESVVERALAKFGRIDALAHVAGHAPLQPIDQTSNEDWQAILGTNLSAAFYFCRALWPVWRRQGAGAAVFVSSEAARNPFIGLAAYGAAKAGLNNLGLGLAREGASIGVRVHVVAPGAVETAMLRAIITPQQVPPERTLKPEDVAVVIAQCVRGDLRYASGEVIYVHKTI